MAESDNVQLDGFQGSFLRHELLDDRLEARVRLQQLLAETALHGGLDLGAVARRDTARKKLTTVSIKKATTVNVA